MSTADLFGPAEPAPATRTDATTRQLYRIAGLGGVGAFLAWLGQPILVTLMGDTGENGTAWADIESAPYQGAAEALVFALIGIGVLFLVLATWRLVTDGLAARGRREPSVAAIAGHFLGLVAAGSWLLVAADSFRLYTSIGASTPDLTSDPALQKAIIEGTYHDVTGELMLFAVAFTGWVVLMTTAGRRAGVIGVPLTVVLLLPVAALVLTLAWPFSVPLLPIIGYVLATLILGISFLIRSRR
jgi:hypothetical protein